MRLPSPPLDEHGLEADGSLAASLRFLVWKAEALDINGEMFSYRVFLDPGADVSFVFRHVVDWYQGNYTIGDVTKFHTFHAYAGGQEVRSSGRVKLQFGLVGLSVHCHEWLHILEDCDTLNTRDVFLGRSFIYRLAGLMLSSSESFNILRLALHAKARDCDVHNES